LNLNLRGSSRGIVLSSFLLCPLNLKINNMKIKNKKIDITQFMLNDEDKKQLKSLDKLSPLSENYEVNKRVKNIKS
jgi:hypothetical protein